MALDFLPFVQRVLNKVQITILNNCIESNLKKNEGSTLPSFLYSVENPMAETAHLTICVITQQVQQHNIY
jgi:UDP-glucose 6-dehydrogenase